MNFFFPYSSSSHFNFFYLFPFPFILLKNLTCYITFLVQSRYTHTSIKSSSNRSSSYDCANTLAWPCQALNYQTSSSGWAKRRSICQKMLLIILEKATCCNFLSLRLLLFFRERKHKKQSHPPPPLTSSVHHTVAGFLPMKHIICLPSPKAIISSSWSQSRLTITFC